MSEILKCKVLDSEAIIPHRATEGAACFDLHAIEGAIIDKGKSHVFATGLAFEIPQGHALMVYSRSGHGFKQGLRLANGTGVIDSDYRGEVMVKLHNDSRELQCIMAHERIAQAMLIKLPSVTIEVVDELGLTERGEGGFGSTGK